MLTIEEEIARMISEGGWCRPEEDEEWESPAGIPGGASTATSAVRTGASPPRV